MLQRPAPPHSDKNHPTSHSTRECLHMITAAQGLTGPQLEAISALEARVVAADGGRLKLEAGVLQTRNKDQVRDFLCWTDADDGDGPAAADTDGGQRLVGFGGIYVFGGATPEIAGMVDPAYRRRGIATALLDAAAAECGRLGHRKVLLVTPRNDAGGCEFAARHCGKLEHSEHAMLLSGEPRVSGTGAASVSLRLLTNSEVPRVAEILAEAFGRAMPDDHDASLTREYEQRLVIEAGGEVVGGMRTTLHGDRGSVYGFAIATDQRGHGIGRAALHRACLQLRERGAEKVALEVATDNDRALGLYESVGFARVITEDYYELSV
jgi:ribosomal protein S18 acetylase RimI-like enzyme